jgi:NAD(P)-dependent dehydrogenase (short-subunit alcohol dehydrogenase family)
MGKLDGKVALITGGSSGIGLATAHEFVGEGAFVFITGRQEAELMAAAREIGRNVSGIRADVSRSDDLDRMISQIKDEKESSMSYSQTLVPRNTHRSARSARSFTRRFSMST